MNQKRIHNLFLSIKVGASKMNNANKITCYSCKKQLELDATQKVLRHEECEHCQTSLHCCKMCIFYDDKVYNECKEPLAERIVEKEKANFCSYFKIGHSGSEGPSKDDLLSAAEALFKK